MNKVARSKRAWYASDGVTRQIFVNLLSVSRAWVEGLALFGYGVEGVAGSSGDAFTGKSQVIVDANARRDR